METDQESRLRRYLAAYERLCKKYGLIVTYDCNDESFAKVRERFDYYKKDLLSDHLVELKESGIDT